MYPGNEDLEFYDEWQERDPELANMSAVEYDEMRCIESYGPVKEDLDCGDE